NQSVHSDSISLKIDTTLLPKPAAPTAYVDDFGDYQSSSSSAAVTDDVTPGIKVAAIPAGAVATLYINGVAVTADYDPVNLTLTPRVALTDGDYQITYTLTNAAGNESDRSDALSFTVDTSTVEKPAKPSNYIDNEGDYQ